MLSAEEIRAALQRIAAWRVDPEKSVACPRCCLGELAIVDRSARPYAEWYQLNCPACGFEAMLNIPLGPSVIGGLD